MSENDDDMRLEQKIERERAMANEWEKKASLALKAGRDELATQALGRKIEHEKIALGWEIELAQKRSPASLVRDLQERKRALDNADLDASLEELKKKLALPILERDDDEVGERGLFGLMTATPTKKWQN